MLVEDIIEFIQRLLAEETKTKRTSIDDISEKLGNAFNQASQRWEFYYTGLQRNERVVNVGALSQMAGILRRGTYRYNGDIIKTLKEYSGNPDFFVGVLCDLEILGKQLGHGFWWDFLKHCGDPSKSHSNLHQRNRRIFFLSSTEILM